MCRLALQSVARFLRSVAYEQVNDTSLRSALRDARGFCNPHAYQWLREANSVLGTALIYRDVLQAALRELDVELRGGGGGRQRLGRWRGFRWRPSRQSVCPACQAQSEAEARYLQALLATLGAEASDSTALDASDGACLPHLLAALRTSEPATLRLVERARRVVDTLSGELDEIVRKEDYRFRHEERTPAERSAPARAIAWAAGSQGVVPFQAQPPEPAARP